MRQLTLHLTRGVLALTLPDARARHNAFTGEGPQPGREIARSLGDLSHNIYTPAEGVEGALAAPVGELLFVDYWSDPDGMEDFFADAIAQQAGDTLFSSREEAEWAFARNGFTFCVPAPYGLPAGYLAMMRAPVCSGDETGAALGKVVSAALSTARRRGQISHTLFVRDADLATRRSSANARRAGGQAVAEFAAPVEILALDWWSTLDGLQEHYGDPTTMDALQQSLDGPVETTVWQQGAGFTEW